MTPYNDNTTRSTTDGSHIGGSFDWDMRTARGNGYLGRQLTNSTRLSTYQEQYSMPRRKGVGAVIGICLMFIALYLAVLELGILDEFYVWLIGE